MRFLVAFALVVGINILLFLSQYSAAQIATDAGQSTPIPTLPSIVNHFNNSGNGDISNYNYTNDLPVSPSTGVSSVVQLLIFPIQIFINFVQTAFWIFSLFFTQMYTLLVLMQVPQIFAVTLCALWDAISLGVIIFTFIK